MSDMLDDELRQELESEIEQLRADMALLKTENATYTKYGSCRDCGFPLDKTDDDDIVCHKCSDEIGYRIIAQLEAERDELARQLEQARKWARVWKSAAKWQRLGAAITFT